MSDNRKQALSGVKWMSISTFATALVSLLRISILTRFLEKTDFGVVAILTLVLGLTQTFADLGFSTSIMHKQDLSRKEFSSLYWVQLIVFVILYLIISSFSPLIALFYEENSLTFLLPLSLLDLLFYGIGRLYDTVLQKEMRFRTIAVRNMVTSLLSLVLVVILAICDWGVYSLIFSTLFYTFSNNVWNAISGQRFYKLQLYISLKESAQLIRIGVYQTGTQIVDYLASKLDILIMGKFLGTELLGVYSLAKELLMKAISLINTIVNRVLLPILSKVQNDDEVLTRIFVRVIRWLALIDFPVCLLIGVLSIPIVSIFYGEGYNDVARIVSILSIWALFQSIGNPTGNLAIAKGRTDISFVYTLIRILIAVPIVYVTSLLGVYWVAWGQIIFSIVMTYVGYRMLISKMLRLSFINYVSSFVGLWLIVVAIGLFTYDFVANNYWEINGFLLQFCVYGLCILVIYTVSVLFFYKNSLIELVRFIRAR